MKKNLIKHSLIAGATIFTMTGIMVFAQTAIDTDVYNAVQTIMRTVYSDDGSAGGNTLVDINNDDGHIYIDQSVLAAPTDNSLHLGLNDNNELTIMTGGGGTTILSGEIDHDRYQVGTTQTPTNINNNIYPHGQVGINTNETNNSTLQVFGNILFGDQNNRAGSETGFSSVLGGLGNHVEAIRSTIAGGFNNNIVADAAQSFIGAGGFNTIHAWASVIGGGEYNTINNGYATAYATIGGGRNNSILGELSTIGGGGYHAITKSFGVIAGGYQNGVNGNFGTIGGGKNNTTHAYASTVAGGDSNSVTNIGAASFIGGGSENRVSNANSAIVGGYKNITHGLSSIIGGGEENTIEGGTNNSLVGGRLNTIKDGDRNILGGGTKNFVRGFGNAVVGGYNNIIKGSYSSIIGGRKNKSEGNYSSIIGGQNNMISSGSEDSFIVGSNNSVYAKRSIAMGVGAIASHDNVFVRNDTINVNECSSLELLSCLLQLYDCPTDCELPTGGGQSTSFSSTNTGQFLVNATNGVGINTNSPQGSLHVGGDVIIDVIPAHESFNGTTRVLVQGSNNQLQYVQASQLLEEGITQTINLTDEQGSPCTMTIEAGIVTATTCQ